MALARALARAWCASARTPSVERNRSMKLVLLTLFVAALAGCAIDAPALSVKEQHVDGCGPGIDSYINENGEEVICVHTEAPPWPSTPPDDPWENPTDPCAM